MSEMILLIDQRVRILSKNIVIILFLLPIHSYGQANSAQTMAVLDSLQTISRNFTKDHPIEKVYIHFDKPFYILGEDCWYKAYVVNDADFSPTNISNVLYVDWIDPNDKIISHQRLRIDNGEAVGDFAMDTTFSEGIFKVRAYTNWMRNFDRQLFFYKEISVFNPRSSSSEGLLDTIQQRIDLQLFPEGGTLITGVQTNIAFRAIDVRGIGISVKGAIVDENDNQVITFQSSHKGMGAFPFTAQPQKAYRAVLQNGESYPMPAAKERGLVLTASNRDERNIRVKIQASKDHLNMPVFLIGHSRGSVSYAAYAIVKSESTYISIPKHNLPAGVINLTLFDHAAVPRCERMLFIRKERKAVINMTSNKRRFLPRDSISLRIEVRDNEGKPMPASMSISVTDADFFNADQYEQNIYTTLLLQSNIRGRVENPGWYFEPSNSDRFYFLDLVMLTHGWSRYYWDDIMSKSSDTPMFFPEAGITLKGQIIDKNKPVPNTPFALSGPQSENNFFNIYESDSLGRFVIPGLDFYDSIMFEWRIMSGKKGKAGHAKVQLDTAIDIPPIITFGSQNRLQISKDKLLEDVVGRFLKTGVWNLDNTRVLEEVVVTGRRDEIKVVGADAIAVKPSSEDLKGLTSQFINRYALGLSGARLVSRPDGTDFWTTQNGWPISISINGFVQENTGLGANPFGVLNSIPIEAVEQIIISRGTIAILTKETATGGGDVTIRRLIKGFDSFREFYHPKYGPSDFQATVPDNRITLYWNPRVRTDDDGIATITFYNTDVTDKLSIVVEGIAGGILVSSIDILD